MSEKRIRIKETGAEFTVPMEFYNKVNGSPLSLKHYAVQSGQLDYKQAWNREPESVPEANGAFDAAMIGAGRTLDKLGSNISQAWAGLTGNDEEVENQKRRQAEIDRLAQPVKQEHPVASFTGEALPYFAAPGGKVAQVMFGAAEGALEGDTLEDRLSNAALGSLFAFAGQKAGDKIGQATQNLIGKIKNTPDAQARRALQKAGIPLTLSQRGSPIAKFFERMQFVLSGKQPKSTAQVKAINKLAAKAIGEKANTLDKSVLGKAHSKIGNVFEDAASKIDAAKVSQGNITKMQDILSVLKKDGYDVARTKNAADNLTAVLTSPDNITGDVLFNQRQKLGKLSRALWKKGEDLDAEAVDSMIELVDDVIASNSPAKAIDDLARARSQWRFLRALRSGRAVDAEGNINFNSMDSAMRRMYPGFEVGKVSNAEAGDFGSALDAIRRIQKPPKSSGTAENLITAGAIPGLAALGVGGGTDDAGSGAGAAGMALALALSGGGAGGQLGGGAARALANQLYDFQGRKVQR